MFIKERKPNYLILKEVNYGVLFRTAVVFFVALIITINSKNAGSISITSLFITGPLLMAASFLSAIFFFKNITILINNEEITRTTWRMNKVKEEGLSLIEVESLEIMPSDVSLINFTGRTKYDIYLKFKNNSIIKLNTFKMSGRRASKICSEICSIILIPFNKTEKENIFKAISSIRKSLK